MAVRRMTERMARLFLAAKWRNPEMCVCRKRHIIVITLNQISGLCDAIDALFAAKQISARTRNAMRRRLGTVRREGVTSFWWGLNKAGAKIRAAVCARLARQCARVRKAS